MCFEDARADEIVATVSLMRVDTPNSKGTQVAVCVAGADMPGLRVLVLKTNHSKGQQK